MSVKTTRASRKARRLIRTAAEDPSMTVFNLAVLAVLQTNAGRSSIVEELPEDLIEFETRVLLHSIAKVPQSLYDTRDATAKQKVLDAFRSVYSKAWEGGAA